jgi:hypothetical protein
MIKLINALRIDLHSFAQLAVNPARAVELCRNPDERLLNDSVSTRQGQRRGGPRGGRSAGTSRAASCGAIPGGGADSTCSRPVLIRNARRSDSRSRG